MGFTLQKEKFIALLPLEKCITRLKNLDNGSWLEILTKVHMGQDAFKVSINQITAEICHFEIEKFPRPLVVRGVGSILRSRGTLSKQTEDTTLVTFEVYLSTWVWYVIPVSFILCCAPLTSANPFVKSILVAAIITVLWIGFQGYLVIVSKNILFQNVKKALLDIQFYEEKK